MAENKQYIIQKQESGSLLISEDVICTIVAHAISEVEGVDGLVTKPGSDIAEFIGKKNWGKGIKIQILDDETVAVDCNVTIVYGHSVVNVAKAAQEAIVSAVNSMTGVNAKFVNVNVCGINRK